MNQEKTIIMKKRTPKFVRQEIHKKKRLAKKWRMPKGLHSKIRLAKAGHRKSVKVGYGNPAEVRHLTKEGLLPMIIHNLMDIQRVDIKKNCAVVSSAMGQRKRVLVIKKLKELNIRVINVKDIDVFLNGIEEKLKAKKEKKEKTKKEKAEKTKELEKKAKEKEKQTKEEVPEEGSIEKMVAEEEKKKEEEKKEFEKIITKKE